MSARRRWVYRETSPGHVEAIEVTQDYSDAPRSTGDLGKFEYDNMRATDGTDISSRTKHARYMKQNNLALVSDYSEKWQESAKERENFFSGRHSHQGMREAIAHAYDAVKKRGKK